MVTAADFLVVSLGFKVETLEFSEERSEMFRVSIGMFVIR